MHWRGAGPQSDVDLPYANAFSSDYKVVAAGYPLMIFARDKNDRSGRTRIGVLEMNNGQLRMRSVGTASFTPQMVQRIQTVLDASLPQIGKTAPK